MIPRITSHIAATAAVVFFATSAFAAESADSTIQAVWKPQEIDFHYQSFTTFYSCDALESRVETIMRAVGVREDLRVRVTGCPGNAPSRIPYVRIDLVAPVPATPEAIAELEKDRTKRELAARVRGERAEELTAQFPAQWKKVNLSHGNLGIDPGECELIEELNQKVFPKLAIKVIREDVSCTPGQRSIGQPQLEIQALTKAPDPDEAPKK